MSYKYKFSIVSAVYKVEEFVAETIESLISQTIGFKNIQLILVDDGSPDGSGAICDKYAAKYDNILVIHKENGGVSSARNAGLEKVEGKYVNFIDSDDLLTPSTLKKVWEFFEAHEDETDVVSIPLFFFDGRTGNHHLNFKFEQGTRVIDLLEDWFNPQLSMSSSFIKASALKGVKVDSRLAFAEDAQLIQKLLLNKCTLGVVAEGMYMYRRRLTGAPSALQTTTQRAEWYLPCLKYFHIEILEYYKEKMGYVPKFIQASLMYDIQWRIRQNEFPEEAISEEEKQEYIELIRYIIGHFDPDVINIQKQLTAEFKLLACRIKYGRAPDFNFVDDDIELCYDGVAVSSISTCASRLENFEYKDGEVTLEGFINMYDLPFDGFEVKVDVNGELFDCSLTDGMVSYSFEQMILKRHKFCCKFPINKDKNTIAIKLIVNGRSMTVKHNLFGKFFPIGNYYWHLYHCFDKYMLTQRDGKLFINKCGLFKKIKREIGLQIELWQKRDNGAAKASLARIALPVLCFFKRKPVWIISDRIDKAGDNGEAFFRYMCENHPEIDARFVIERGCDDYERMKAVGKVLVRDSFKHKLLLLMSEYIVSSHAEDYIFNPFYSYFHAYRDMLYKRKFVFLQHGVIMNDLSDWLYRFNKRIFGFITSAKGEYDSIASADYDYDENQVWLTGLPRFDRLYDKDEKCVTIMPTWRKYIFKGYNKAIKAWEVNDDFEESDYLTFYRGLLTHERLNKALEDYGYTLAFLPHPNLQSNIDYFKVNDKVRFFDASTDYRDVYAISSLIVCDYSSAVFDFAYLRKPIVYAQFDAEDFFGGKHTVKKGYFDYERDGFGEVEHDLEATVDRIIEYLKNGCQLKEKYEKRIDEFFAYSDKNNCERIYNKMIEKR